MFDVFRQWRKEIIFVGQCQYLFTGTETISVWLEVKKVEAHEWSLYWSLRQLTLYLVKKTKKKVVWIFQRFYFSSVLFILLLVCLLDYKSQKFYIKLTTSKLCHDHSLGYWWWRNLLDQKSSCCSSGDVKGIVLVT